MSHTDPLTHEILAMLFDVVGRVRAHFTDVAAGYELTPQQAHALRWLGEPVAMGELAGALHCDPSNVTGITDRLETRGFVERRTDPSDRRVKQLVLTEAGREMRDEFLDLLHSRLPVVSGLSDADRTRLHDLLGKILAADPLGPEFDIAELHRRYAHHHPRGESQ